MQILVLGMHRSGTSAVVRLLNMMGAHLGPPESVKGANPENPKGFWENEDLVELDKDVLGAQRCLWDRLGEFDSAKLADEKLATLQRRAKDFLIRLDHARPWAVKDPRMCLLLPFWRPILELPVCVLVNRNPLEVARSLRTRNGIPLNVGIALWELHNLEVLRGSAGLPRILVQYADIVKDAVGSTRWLLNRLTGFGVRKLELPADDEITSFIDPALYREKMRTSDEDDLLTPPQRRLRADLTDGSALDMTDVPPLSEIGRETLKAYDVGLYAQADVKHLRGLVKQGELELRQVREAIAELTKTRNELEAELRDARAGTPNSSHIEARIEDLIARVAALEQRSDDK